MNGSDWITFHLPPDTDLSGAGIYFWEVGADTYVGKAARLDGRLREYINNVRKIEHELPYRKSKPDRFREVHLALAEAKRGGLPVHWRVLETCPPGPPLLERERHWIAALSPTLNRPTRQRRSGA